MIRLSQFESILDEFNAGDLPQWQKSLLDKRLERHLANPNDGEDWESVKQRLRSKIKAWAIYSSVELPNLEKHTNCTIDWNNIKTLIA